MSKIKELFTPRFKEITALIDKVQVLAKQDSLLDDEIRDLGEKNNLLNTESARDNIAKGLVYLKHEGWLSDREYQVLSDSLAHTLVMRFCLFQKTYCAPQLYCNWINSLGG